MPPGAGIRITCDINYRKTLWKYPGADAHATLTALLWYHGKIYTTRIWDIEDIVDSVGVGDAFVAGYIHASERWPGEARRNLDFATAAAMLKNSIPEDMNLVTEEEILSALGLASAR